MGNISKKRTKKPRFCTKNDNIFPQCYNSFDQRHIVLLRNYGGKIMKKKSLSLLLSGLLAVSLTGVGFASWYISQSVSEEKSGNIQVEEFVDASLEITNVSLTEESFKFGADRTGIDDPWLKNDGEGEVLTTVLTFDITNFDKAVTLDITFEATGGNYSTAVSDGYIVEPTNKTLTKDDLTTSANADGTTKVTVTYTYDWGAKFGNENPYQYYNLQTKTDELAKEAQENMENLYTYLTGVTYKISINAES